jgi:hypothetical protein
VTLGEIVPGICSNQVPAGGLAHTLCPSQAPRLEPLHEEDLVKSPNSVSLGRGRSLGFGLQVLMK